MVGDTQGSVAIFGGFGAPAQVSHQLSSTRVAWSRKNEGPVATAKAHLETTKVFLIERRVSRRPVVSLTPIFGRGNLPGALSGRCGVGVQLIIGQGDLLKPEFWALGEVHDSPSRSIDSWDTSFDLRIAQHFRILERRSKCSSLAPGWYISGLYAMRCRVCRVKMSGERCYVS